MDHSVGDTTDLLPRVAAARRNLHILLAVLTVGLLALVVILTVAPPMGGSAVTPETSAALDAEAKRLAVIFDATIKAAHVQADTMAKGTQIRAGIMTDAATVKDLVTSEIQLPRNLNQTLELAQLLDAQRNILLRMPDGAPPISVTHANETRLEIDGRKELAVVVGAPIVPVDEKAQMLGELVLSTPLDFAVTRDNLAGVTTHIAITGSNWRFDVVDAAGATGPVQRLGIPLDPSWRAPSINLEATPRVTPARAAWVTPVKLGAGIVALVLALVLALSLYRNRDP